MYFFIIGMLYVATTFYLWRCGHFFGISFICRLIGYRKASPRNQTSLAEVWFVVCSFGPSRAANAPKSGRWTLIRGYINDCGWSVCADGVIETIGWNYRRINYTLSIRDGLCQGGVYLSGHSVDNRKRFRFSVEHLQMPSGSFGVVIFGGVVATKMSPTLCNAFSIDWLYTI